MTAGTSLLGLLTALLGGIGLFLLGMTMLTDGLKNLNKEEEVQVKDVAEVVVEKLGI